MYGPNQLARNSQVQAARARLAQRQVPGGAQQGNMAGCYDGASCEPFNLPPGAVQAPGGGAIRQGNTPCNTIVQTTLGSSVVVQVSMRGGGWFWACGISSCNNCFEVIINGIRAGSLEVNVLACPDVDAGIFNTDECWCPMDIGCFNSISPLEYEFSAFGTPSVAPFANVTLWGTAVRGYADCGYPYGMPVGGPGAWQNANGR